VVVVVKIAGGVAELYTVEGPGRVVVAGPYEEYDQAETEAATRRLVLMATKFAYNDSGWLKDFTPGGEDEGTEPEPGLELAEDDGPLNWTVDGCLTLYGCEDADGGQDTGPKFRTLAAAERHARAHKLRVIDFEYFFTDSELVKDFTTEPDPADAEPEPDTFGRMFCDWITADPHRTVAQAWAEFSHRYAANPGALGEMFDQVVRLSRMAARTLGTTEGATAAEWVFDGNTDHARYVRCVEWDAAGDPRWHEEFGAGDGPLSGQWSDSRTPAGLLAELGVGQIMTAHDESGEAEQEITAAYENAYLESWSARVLSTAVAHIRS
jgi:hypothetical protein